jgi:hypothetical protein
MIDGLGLAEDLGTEKAFLIRAEVESQNIKIIDYLMPTIPILFNADICTPS